MGPLAVLGLNLAAGGIQQGLQNRYNRKQQEKSFEQNKEFWHERYDKEAKYNSPVEQRARMQQAGLNPAMMYKQGAGSGNVKGGGAQGKMADRMNMANLAATSAQTAKIIEDTAKAKVEANYIKSKTTGQNTDNSGKIISNAIQSLNLKKGQAQYESQVQTTISQAVKAAAEAQSSEAQLEILQQTRLKIMRQTGIDINNNTMTNAFQAAVEAYNQLKGKITINPLNGQLLK